MRTSIFFFLRFQLVDKPYRGQKKVKRNKLNRETNQVLVNRLTSHKSGNAYEQQLTKHEEATNYFLRNLKLYF